MQGGPRNTRVPENSQFKLEIYNKRDAKQNLGEKDWSDKTELQEGKKR